MAKRGEKEMKRTKGKKEVRKKLHKEGIKDNKNLYIRIKDNKEGNFTRIKVRRKINYMKKEKYLKKNGKSERWDCNSLNI